MPISIKSCARRAEVLERDTQIGRRAELTAARAQRWRSYRGLPKSNLPTLALFALVTGSILLGKRVAPRIPLLLFAIVRTIAATSDAIIGQVGLIQCRPKTRFAHRASPGHSTEERTKASSASDALAFSAHESSRVMRLAPP